MALLFISNIVPDRPPYNNCVGFTRSSNNVFLGIEAALPPDAEAELVSCRPIASFPHGPIWIAGEDVQLKDGRIIHILPCLNIIILKNIYWGWKIKSYIKRWAKKHKGTKLHVLTYNIYTPPISSIFKACNKYKCKLSAILYDLGVPPTHLGLNKVTMMGYKYMESVAKKYIPLLDGRVIINELISKHYAPDKSSILIDGGINDIVISKLFPIVATPGKQYTFVLAGLQWAQNGTRLLLDCLQQFPKLDLKVIFAGWGPDVDIIKKAAANDSRIDYAGILNQDDLFKLYEKADVLLNLRVEDEVDYHFPSKLLEYLVTGKHVVSTDIAHAERDYGAYISVLKEKTPMGLRELIQEIISEDKQQYVDKGIAARNFMLNNRTWKKRTEEILDYIEHV